MTKHKMLQSLTQKMAGRQSESGVKSIHIPGALSLRAAISVCVYVKRHFYNNKSNIMKIKKESQKMFLFTPKGTSANRFESTPQDVLHLTCVCACALAHTHTHIYTHPTRTTAPIHLCISCVIQSSDSSYQHIYPALYLSCKATNHHSTSRAKHRKTYLPVAKKKLHPPPNSNSFTVFPGYKMTCTLQKNKIKVYQQTVPQSQTSETVSRKHTRSPDSGLSAPPLPPSAS